MLEMIINPKKAERNPWEMFLIGLIYAFVSVGLAYIMFAKDPVLSQYMSWIIILFCVIFSLPFMYYMIKLEEQKDREYDSETTLLKEHGKAILAFLALFLGFVVAFSICYVLIPNGEQFFKSQISVFCQINRPDNFADCLQEYGLSSNIITGNMSSTARLTSIFSNNVYVLIFSLIFSLLFGAGAIFILAWNASVIAAAIGIFIKSDISHLPLGIARYMIHGLPEIAAYFITALAGGILSRAIIRKDIKNEKFWSTVQDSITLIIIALVILIIAALIEVFITPKLF